MIRQFPTESILKNIFDKQRKSYQTTEYIFLTVSEQKIPDKTFKGEIEMKQFKKLSAAVLMSVTAAASGLCFSTNTATAAGKTYKVMIINFDPTFEVNGKTLKQHELAGSQNDTKNLIPDWNDPYRLADEFAQTMSEISYGNVNYEIAEKIELDEMPRSTAINGAAYTKEEYYDTLMTAIEKKGFYYFGYEGWKKLGFTFDYEYYLGEYAYDKINSGAIDEVWFFAGPCLGLELNETAMIGNDAFPVNNVAIHKDGMRNFIAYGFNYERGVAEMLEDAGHRQEWIMNKVVGGAPDYTKDYSQYNDWEKFTAYDKVAPGKSGVGDVHHAPNSPSDYKWDIQESVDSYCDNWYNYPDLSGPAIKVNCEAWGKPYALNHKKWWFRHLPHAPRKNAETGLYNNWWTYFTLDYLNDPPVEKYSIGSCSFSSVPDAAYTGSAIKPAVTVKSGSVTLRSGTDYTVAYKNNTKAGTATITVTGKGEYTGTKDITFNILPKKLTAPTIAAIPEKTYTGSEIKPSLTVKDGDRTLTSNTDYTLAYKNNTNVGTATVTVTFKGNYSGSQNVTFRIVPRKLTYPSISSIPNQTYTGSAIKPTPTVKDGGKTLTSGTDYTISYADNVNVGTASLTVTFKGNYSGSKTVNFKIVPCKLTDATISAITDKTYTGNEIKPTPTVKAGNRTLKRDTDYTLAYKNNVKVGTAIVTVTGKGNYSGTKSVTFRIVPRKLTNPTISSISDVTYTGNPFKPTPTVKDGSKTLTSGTDYTLAYKNNTNAGTAIVTVTFKGNYSGSKSVTFKILPKKMTAPTVLPVPDQTYTGSAIKPTLTVKDGNKTLILDKDYTVTYSKNVSVGTVTVTITFKGNYSGSWTVKFKIVPKKLTSPTVSSIPDKTYTGSPICPTPTVKDGNKTLTRNTDYTLTYKNNTNAGTATVTITFKGNYSGTKSVTFRILPKKLTSPTIASISNQTYTGKEIKPTPTVKDGSKTLTRNTDYTLTYKNNVKVGTATVTVTFKGNYSGSRGVTFRIVSR